MALSLVFELWVSIFVGGPILPGFVVPPSRRTTRSCTGRATTSSTAAASRASWATPICSAPSRCSRSSCSRSASPPARRGATLLGVWIGAVGLPLLPRRRPRPRTSRPPRVADRARHGAADAPRDAARRAHQVLHRLRGRRARRRARAAGCCATRSSPRSAAAPTSPAARRIWAGRARARGRAAARPAGASRRRGCRAIRRSTGGSSTTARPSCRPTTCGSTSFLQLGIIGVVLMGARSTSRSSGAPGSSPSTARAGICAPTAPTRRSRCCRRSSARSCSCRGSPSPARCCCGAGCSWSCSAFKIKQSPHVGVGPAEQSARDRAWRADEAGVVTDAPRGAAPARWIERAAGLGSLRPRLHARRPRRGLLGLRDRADRRAASPTSRSSSGSASSAIGMLVARRREISLRAARAHDPASLFVGVGARQRRSGARTRPRSFWSWVSTAALAFLAVVDRARARHAADRARARRRAARAAVDLARRSRCSSGVLLDMPFRFLGIQGNIAQLGPIQGIFGTRNLLGLRRRHRAHHVPHRVPHAVRARRASRSSPSCSPAGLAALSDSPTVLVLAVARRPRRRRARARAARARRSAAPRCSGRSAALVVVGRRRRLCGAASDHRAARRRHRLLDARRTCGTRWSTTCASKPVQGWGWFGPWNQREFPFNAINFGLRRATRPALNAYFDVLLQLGWVGLLLFVAFAGVALVRSWLDASERRSVIYAWTPLILVALLVDSMFESFTLFGLRLAAARAVRGARRPVPLVARADRRGRRRAGAPARPGRAERPAVGCSGHAPCSRQPPDDVDDSPSTPPPPRSRS